MTSSNVGVLLFFKYSIKHFANCKLSFETTVVPLTCSIEFPSRFSYVVSPSLHADMQTYAINKRELGGIVDAA